jgi:hypothetical protein
MKEKTPPPICVFNDSVQIFKNSIMLIFPVFLSSK